MIEFTLSSRFPI